MSESSQSPPEAESPPTSTAAGPPVPGRSRAVVCLAAAAVASAVLGIVGVVWLTLEVEREKQRGREGEQALRLEQEKAEAERKKAEDLAKQLEDQRQGQYALSIALAWREWQANNIDRYRKMLDGCPEDLRGWEWDYLNHLRTASAALGDRRSEKAFVALSPDGSRIALGAYDGVVMSRPLWGTGQEWFDRTNHVVALAISPDNRILAAALVYDSYGPAAFDDPPTRIEIRAVGSGEKTQAIKDWSSFKGLCFDATGQRLAAAGGDGQVKVYDVASGKLLLELKGHIDVTGLAFAPHGKLLYSAGLGPAVKFWDLDTGKDVFTILNDDLPVTALALSPDGATLAGAGLDQTIRLWSTRSGEEAGVLRGHTAQVRALNFSPDGRRLASGGYDRTIKIWSTQTGNRLFELRGHRGPVRSLQFSPGGQQLVSSDDGDDIRIWDAAREPEVQVLPAHRDPVTSVTFSPDGRRLATGGRDGLVKVWDAERLIEEHTLAGHGDKDIMAVFVSNKRLASIGRPQGSDNPGDFRLWDLTTGKELRTQIPPARINHMAVSPDGERLALALHDGWLRIWEVGSGKESFAKDAHDGPVTGVAFSHDGRRLASVGSDRTLLLCDLETGACERSACCDSPKAEGKEGVSPNTVAFSADGRFVAVGCGLSNDSGLLQIWDVAAGRWVQLITGIASPVREVAWTPDGRRLATATGGEVQLWDPRTGRELLSLNGLTALAFSPDGLRLAAASTDRVGGGLRIWDATPSSKDRLKLLPKEIIAQNQARKERTNLDLLRREAEGSDAARQWRAARFYRSQLISLEPNDGQHYAYRGRAYLALGRLDDALADFRRAIEEFEIADAWLREHRATILCRQERWRDALADWQAAVDQDTPNIEAWYACALLRLHGQDEAGYRKACAAFLERFRDTDDADTAYWAVYAAMLAPKAVDEPMKLLDLARRTANANDKDANFLGVVGAVHYRAGKYQEAVDYFTRATQVSAVGGQFTEWLLLAMAHQQLARAGQEGHAELAQKWFDKAVAWYKEATEDDNKDHPTWSEKLEFEILRREAEELLKK